MVLAALASIGPLAWKGFKFINDRTNGKFGKYLGGKALELGAYATKKLLKRANNDTANKVAEKVAEEAVEAAKEITGEDSYVTKKVSKAANIVAPGTTVETLAVHPTLNATLNALPSTMAMMDNVPYSKRLYGTNFQRYSPKILKKVKVEHGIIGRHRGKTSHSRHRVLHDINE